MAGAYPSEAESGERGPVAESLEAYVREGARRMLAAALEAEVAAFLGRGRYERGKPFRGYRTGYHEPRELTVGVGAVEVRVPRVADVPPEVAPGLREPVAPAGLGKRSNQPGLKAGSRGSWVNSS